jgi:class 3 adenylate cyclase
MAERAYAGMNDEEVREIEEAASRVRLPTLVLRRPAHRLSPRRDSDPIIALLPGAQRVDIPGQDLMIFGGEVDALVSEITRFVTGEHRVPSPERVLTTIMYTDLVASTERATQMGDARWKRVLDQHDEIARSCIGRRGGHVIKHMGDGLLATLPSASTALRAAQELRTALRAVGSDVRIGIHVGDVDRRGDDISGLNVVIAARLLDLASGGDILLTSTALTATGEPIPAEARGDHNLKGVPGTRAVYNLTDA